MSKNKGSSGAPHKYNQFKHANSKFERNGDPESLRFAENSTQPTTKYEEYEDKPQTH